MNQPDQHSADDSESSLVDALLRLALDYVGWTQIVPAVVIWAFALFMLLALVLTGMDVRGENPADAMLAFSERYPALSEQVAAWFESTIAPRIEAAADPDTGAVHFDRIDFSGFASTLWLGLSLIGWLLGALLTFLRGPRPPWPLRFKLLLAGGACIGLVLGFVAVMMLSGAPFEGSLLGWLATFSSIGLLVFLVTAWAIGWSHGLAALGRRLSSPATPVILGR